MLNFDSRHTFVDGNLNEKGEKKTFKDIVIGGLIITNLLFFSGCSKNVACDVEGAHAHYYVNDDNIGRYIVSEKSSVSGLRRLDNYISIDKEDKKVLKFLHENDLFIIDDNKDAIDDIAANQLDHKEYRYSYYYLMPIPITHTW